MKLTLYPKTERHKPSQVVVTEKLDGSNLGIGYLSDYQLLVVAQRNNVFFLEDIDDLEEHKNKLYKGLYGWLKEHWDILNNIYPDSIVFGEWIGMGKIKYDFQNKWFVFAKAILEVEGRDSLFLDKTADIYSCRAGSIGVRKIDYTLDYLKFPFGGEIPDFISCVPLVDKLSDYPTKETLDKLYDDYAEMIERPVEGFVVNHQNSIVKYVRHKNGKPTAHTEGNQK